MSAPSEQPGIDRQQAAIWLKDRWKGPKTCHICQSNRWIIDDTVSELPQSGGRVLPLLAVTCDVCGHTLLFNVTIDDIASQPPATSTSSSAEATTSPEETT